MKSRIIFFFLLLFLAQNGISQVKLGELKISAPEITQLVVRFGP
jgi:hypothetical protein